MNKRLLSAALALPLSLFPSQAAEIQRLDAPVAGSIVASGTGGVTSWADQSGSGNGAAVPSGSVSYPSSALFPAGLSGVGFGPGRSSLQLFSSAVSDSWLDQSAGTTGFCVLVAFRSEALNSDWNDLIGNSSSVNSGFGMRYNSSGVMVAYLGGVSLQKGSGASVNAGDTIVYAFNYIAGSGACEFWDSKNDSSLYATSPRRDFSSATPVTLGSTNSAARFFTGSVGEVRVFNHALTAAEFQNQREALTWKWANIPVSVPLQWRVIPEDPNYLENDAVMAGIVIGDPAFANPLPGSVQLRGGLLRGQSLPGRRSQRGHGGARGVLFLRRTLQHLQDSGRREPHHVIERFARWSYQVDPAPV